MTVNAGSTVSGMVAITLVAPLPELPAESVIFIVTLNVPAAVGLLEALKTPPEESAKPAGNVLFTTLQV